MLKTQVGKLKHTFLAHVAVLVEIDINLYLPEVWTHRVAASRICQGDLELGAEQTALSGVDRNQFLGVLHVLLRGFEERLEFAGQFNCVSRFFLAFILKVFYLF